MRKNTGIPCADVCTTYNHDIYSACWESEISSADDVTGAEHLWRHVLNKLIACTDWGDFPEGLGLVEVLAALCADLLAASEGCAAAVSSVHAALPPHLQACPSVQGKS
jgi:hypothetical protein